MKSGAKSAGVADWKVTLLEALWWAPSGRDIFDAGYATMPAEMAWKALLMQPAVMTTEMLEQAKAEVVRKKKDVPALAKVRLSGDVDQGIVRAGDARWATCRRTCHDPGHACLDDQERLPRARSAPRAVLQ